MEVIVEHFRTTVMTELGGMAKAMLITASRQGAVKYHQAFEEYTKKKDTRISMRWWPSPEKSVCPMIPSNIPRLA